MSFSKIELSAYSKLRCEAAVSSDCAVLLLSFAGEYRSGSGGNGDGLYMAAMTAAYCSLFEPASLVLDLEKLNYIWGNTISRTINFFWETGRDDDERSRSVVIVATGANRSALETIEGQITSGNRFYADTVAQALVLAEESARDYLA